MFDSHWFRVAAVLTNAVISLLILMTGAYYIGQWLDHQLGSAPYLMMGLLVAAMALGFAWIIILAKKLGL